ncbi:ECF sigma factor [Pseudobythopirellula maris]|uniref:ECF sigma factor n=1 Tax=Pseudobythopirellula maris TaxID=2527991 RepID=A0A5C5ZHG7_9BACT|nr:ECF-type sigma factor [Pseudobythopirellula maris]TWT86545.1 ECF sigma factor [Pseudobythopirellula maris]
MTTRPHDSDQSMADTSKIDAHGSVTQWIADLKDGDDSTAQQELWNRYFSRLVAFARVKLGNAPRGAEDEEDVALSALESLFHGFERDRFPMLGDRGNLWSLLAKITARKAINQRAKQMAQKRGGGKAALRIGSAEESMAGVDPADDDLGPEFLVAMQEECQRLMSSLPDDTLRDIAQRKLEGCTNAEIASQLGVVERTVERKLGLIRTTWAPDLAV